jgi:hypothetical protein
MDQTTEEQVKSLVAESMGAVSAEKALQIVTERTAAAAKAEAETKAPAEEAEGKPTTKKGK